jgi:hypothetical protein
VLLRISCSSEYAIRGGFYIASLVVTRLSRQSAAGDYLRGAARQDGESIPCRLAAPHRAKTGGLGRRQPVEQIRQAFVDVVDVEGGDPRPPAAT